MKPSDPRVLGYTTLRLAIGMTMLIHGLNRIGHMSAFANKTAQEFAHTGLPHALVLGFAYALPSVELIIGILVLLGLFTRTGLVAGGLWMVALIFGSTLIEHYDIVGIQLTYALIFAALLHFLEGNVLSIDHLLADDAEDSDNPPAGPRGN